jgi:hypothetical protein
MNKSLGDTNVKILVLMLHYSFARCYCQDKLGKGHTELLFLTGAHGSTTI